MKKVLVMGFIGYWLLVFSWLIGCATSSPMNQQEAFPLRNQDPRLGIIINEETAHLNVYLYDESGRLIEQMYLAGVNRHLTINSRNIPKIWIRRLEVGRYKLEIWPFYYQNQLFPPERVRIDLRKQTKWLRVDRDPTDTYYKGRHWAWLLRLNGGNIPDTAHGLPLIKLNVKTWGGLRSTRNNSENPACRYAGMCN